MSIDGIRNGAKRITGFAHKFVKLVGEIFFCLGKEKTEEEDEDEKNEQTAAPICP